MLSNEEFFVQSLRDHLYYLRSIKEFCLTIELSFYKNNQDYIKKAQDYADKCEELGEETILYTNGFASKEALNSEIYVSRYTLPCELLTEKLFNVDINTDLTKRELMLQEGINPNISDELIQKIQNLNEKALTFAKEFSSFCQEISNKMNQNTLFSYSYLDFFNYLFADVNTYIQDLERIISMESYSPIYAIGYEYNFSETLEMTARFIRDWVDFTHEDVFDMATYYVNSFQEIIDAYLKANISPSVQEELSLKINLILRDYQDFLRDILNRLTKGELYFITPPISIDNIYTSINFYKFILDETMKENEVRKGRDYA